MKRVLCIISSLDAGGAETFLMKLRRALPEDRYQLDFVVSIDGGCYTDEVLGRGGRIFSIPLRREDPVGALRGISRIVRSGHYEHVLKLGDSPIAALDLVAAKLGGAKCLAMRSCNALTGLSWKQRLLDAAFRPLLNRIANVKIAPSALAAEFVFGKGCASREVHLLRNGLDSGVYFFDEEGRQRIRDEFALTDKLVVGHVGRMAKQKNHEYLLKVFKEIKKLREDSVLLLVGAGEGEEQIHLWVKEMGLESSVIFAGVRHDVPQLLSAMDVFVFPSFHEGMPNVVVEAQATGLSCVIADTITREADITGLVSYLPLGGDPLLWADVAIGASDSQRRDTKSDFLSNGYEISIVAKEFVSLIFGEEA